MADTTETGYAKPVGISRLAETNFELKWPQSVRQYSRMVREDAQAVDRIELLEPTERRLLRLCEDVQHAWESAGAKAPATVALCACADDERITHLFRQGRWERYEASLA